MAYDMKRFGYVSVSFRKGSKKSFELSEKLKEFRYLYPVEIRDRIYYRGLMRIRDAKKVHRFLLNSEGYRYKATLDDVDMNSPDSWKRWLQDKRALA